MTKLSRFSAVSQPGATPSPAGAYTYPPDPLCDDPAIIVISGLDPEQLEALSALIRAQTRARNVSVSRAFWYGLGIGAVGVAGAVLLALQLAWLGVI